MCLESAPRKEDETMNSSKMKAFLINTVLGILSFNGFCLLKSTFTYTPFEFSVYWGVLVPILCAAVAVATPKRKARLG